ncbi:uncharacterized protein LOC119345502 [Triticum dicoccoides]|uniref:uncharacterized protein LOC119345502 n=1 Tax=Triticum dicoccoides TaxID=85692 RepID=UPI0018909461|nr:uncharacterized protein LOC119345502 [Triticum dicoccoides]
MCSLPTSSQVDATVAVFFGTQVNIVGFSLSLIASVNIAAGVAVARGAQPHGAGHAAAKEERRRSIQGRGAGARFMPHGGTRLQREKASTVPVPPGTPHRLPTCPPTALEAAAISEDIVMRLPLWP